ncbi:MAG: hypothetical protein V4543_13700 [Bacteroidota bacterium]
MGVFACEDKEGVNPGPVFDDLAYDNLTVGTGLPVAKEKSKYGITLRVTAPAGLQSVDVKNMRTGLSVSGFPVTKISSPYLITFSDSASVVNDTISYSVTAIDNKGKAAIPLILSIRQPDRLPVYFDEISYTGMLVVSPVPVANANTSYSASVKLFSKAGIKTLDVKNARTNQSLPGFPKENIMSPYEVIINNKAGTLVDSAMYVLTATDINNVSARPLNLKIKHSGSDGLERPLYSLLNHNNLKEENGHFVASAKTPYSFRLRVSTKNIFKQVNVKSSNKTALTYNLQSSAPVSVLFVQFSDTGGKYADSVTYTFTAVDNLNVTALPYSITVYRQAVPYSPLAFGQETLNGLAKFGNFYLTSNNQAFSYSVLVEKGDGLRTINVTNIKTGISLPGYPLTEIADPYKVVFPGNAGSAFDTIPYRITVSDEKPGTELSRDINVINTGQANAKSAQLSGPGTDDLFLYSTADSRTYSLYQSLGNTRIKGAVDLVYTYSNSQGPAMSSPRDADLPGDLPDYTEWSSPYWQPTVFALAPSGFDFYTASGYTIAYTFELQQKKSRLAGLKQGNVYLFKNSTGRYGAFKVIQTLPADNTMPLSLDLKIGQ